MFFFEKVEMLQEPDISSITDKAHSEARKIEQTRLDEAGASEITT